MRKIFGFIIIIPIFLFFGFVNLMNLSEMVKKLKEIILRHQNSRMELEGEICRLKMIIAKQNKELRKNYE